MAAVSLFVNRETAMLSRKTGKENHDTEEPSHTSKQDNQARKGEKEAGQNNRFKNHSFLNASLENMGDHLLSLERNG